MASTRAIKKPVVLHDMRWHKIKIHILWMYRRKRRINTIEGWIEESERWLQERDGWLDEREG